MVGECPVKTFKLILQMTFYGKTEDNTRAKGIGVFIHPKFTDFIKEIKCYSNRVIALQVQLSDYNYLCVVQVYERISGYSDEIVEEMYEDVRR